MFRVGDKVVLNKKYIKEKYSWNEYFLRWANKNYGKELVINNIDKSNGYHITNKMGKSSSNGFWVTKECMISTLSMKIKGLIEEIMREDI
jgi:hypothetical protein